MNIYTPEELRGITAEARQSTAAELEIKKAFDELNKQCYRAACRGSYECTRRYTEEDFKTIPVNYAIEKLAELMHDWGFACTNKGSGYIYVEWEGKPTVYIRDLYDED